MHKLPTVNRIMSYGVMATGLAGAVVSALLVYATGATAVLLFTALAIASAGYGFEIVRRSGRPEPITLERVHRLTESVG